LTKKKDLAIVWAIVLQTHLVSTVAFWNLGRSKKETRAGISSVVEHAKLVKLDF
jgi:hypothetical protein